MSDDLVKRLRSMHWCVTTEANGVGVSDRKVASEAADRIEALIAERDDAWAYMSALQGDLYDAIMMKAERDRLREALRDGRRLWAIAQDDRVRLLIQLEQCEKRYE